MEGTPNTEKEKLLTELRSILKVAYKRDLDGTAIKVEDFVGKMMIDPDTKEEITTGLKKKYPSYVDYEMYHFVSFSTPTTGCKFFDFPGDDSIEKFIRSL